jgi:Rad52/22 family double-strand break repair protein
MSAHHVHTVNGLNPEQVKYLLQPLSKARVSQRSQSGRSLSYVEAWDIKRTLIRVFGFGGFSVTADQAECVAHLEGQGKDGKNHVVCWKVRVTLTIPSLDAEYAEYAVGSANLPSVADAHDMAIKTAESDALKRAAINLGTQFGLSLYDNGSTSDVVGRTLVHTVNEEPVAVPEALGGPAVEQEHAASEPDQADPAPPTPEHSERAEEFLAALRELRGASDADRIRGIAALKMAYGDVLDETTMARGQIVTLGRLGDAVATGAL